MNSKNRKLKILLTQPLVSSELMFGKFKTSKEVSTYVFGQACLASIARKAGHEITVLDPYFEKYSKEDYIKFIQERQFDLIGCTIYTINFDKTKELFDCSRRALPNALLLAGGTHPSMLPEETLKGIETLDLVVYGEGELTFIELLEFVSKDRDYRDLKGIAYREKDTMQIKVNPRRELIENLDDFPMPAYDLLPVGRYVPTPNLVRRYPTIAFHVSRGCPYNCAFCQYNVTLGKKFRHRSVDRIIEELFLFKKKYNARGIVFRDSSLTTNPDFVIELCNSMIKNDLRLTWMCNSRTDIMARYYRKLLPLMKKAGCWQISYGCESANQRSLDLLNKATTVEDNVISLNETFKAGIMVSTTWILCLPGENIDDSWRTVMLANKMAPHVCRFFLPTPFPGTDLEKICKRDGGLRKIISYSDYEMISPKNPVYINPLIGKENTLKLLKRAYIKFYTNPKVLYRNLKTIRDLDALRKYWNVLRLFI